MRRLSVSTFGNALYCISRLVLSCCSLVAHLCSVDNIREYYESDGEFKPGIGVSFKVARELMEYAGKKGISLPENQWESLMESVPAIDAALDELKSS